MKCIRFLFLILIIISINSCKKDNIIAVYMEVEDYQSMYYHQDIINVQYTVHGGAPDSVILLIENEPVSTMYDQEGIFNYKLDNIGRKSIQVIAYQGNSTTHSKELRIDIYELDSPELYYQISRIDNLTTYFVGEKLKIQIVPKYSNTNISEFKEITLYLNGNSLGTVSSPPFIFETPEIATEENELIVILEDKFEKVHTIDYNLIVPVDTPPIIDIGIYYHMDYESGTYMTLDQIKLWYEGSDNVNVEYIDFYIDDNYHSTDSINSDRFFAELFIIDSLPAGFHEIYCIAHDDRGLTTSAEKLPISVHKAYDIYEDIIETSPSNNPSIQYVLSSDNLYVINPMEEKIESIVSLPFSNATSLDYISANQKLYIGFDNGAIAYWDQNTTTFSTITTNSTSTVDDIEIDIELNMAIILSNNQLHAINLSTLDIITAPNLDLVDGCIISYSDVERLIIAGGNPGSTGNRFYKLRLYENYFENLDYKSFSNFVFKNIVHNSGDKFIPCSGQSNVGYIVYDLMNFATKVDTFEIRHSQTAALNSNGTIFYAGNDLNGHLYAFNYYNSLSIENYLIPLHDYEYITHIIPVIGDEKVVLTTNTSFYDVRRIVFFRF